MHDVDGPVADEIADHRRESPREPLVLDVVADERDRRRRAAELVDVEAVEGVRDDAEAGRRAGPRPQHRDAIAVRAQPASQLVRAPAAAARDGREGVGDEQHVAGCGHRHPACARRRAHRRDGRVQRPAVRRPAEVLLGAGPRRCAQLAPPIGVGHGVERGSERAGRVAVVEHARLALAPRSAENRPQAGQGRRDDGQARGHVLEHLQGRPVEAAPERRVRVGIERRHAGVGRGEGGRHRVVGQRSGERDAGQALGGDARLEPGAFRAVADQHGAPGGSAALERRHRVDQASDAVPGAERAGEHRDQLAGLTRERHRSDRAGVEAHGVRAPLRLDDLRGRRVRRQDRAIGRDDQIRGAALPFAPAPHRLGDEQAIHGALGRARIVDDRGVHFEDGARADRAGGEQALAAEVVVPLDHDVRAQRRGDGAQASPPQQPQVGRAERRADIVPRRRSCKRRRERLPTTIGGAGADGDVDLVAEGGEPFGDRLDMRRAAEGARHDLIDGGVEDPHRVSVSRAGRRTGRSGSGRTAGGRCP